MFNILSRWIRQLFHRGEKLELSFSKLKTYQECPYRYLLIYSKGLRAPPGPHSSLGHSIHKALELYATRKGSTLEELLYAYQDGWKHEGYADSIQAMEFYQRGEGILKKYFENERTRQSEVLYSEKDFKIDLGFCYIRGIIDRIDRYPDGRIELIEYKTHRHAWKGKAIREDLQLTMYNLACRKGWGLKPDVLSYYFLSQGRKISTERTKSDEKNLLALLKKTCKNIQKQVFEPSTKYCFRCDFQERCIHVQKKDSSGSH